MKILYSFIALLPVLALGEVTIPPMTSLEEIRPLLVENEVKSLEKLIEVNEDRLLVQKELREKMISFQKQKEEFIAGNESQKHAFSMVTNAREILGEIKRENLAYLFSSEYLEELVFFSSIAGKSSPIRP